ncbi:MAG: SDR family oxidoreductase, partial [Pseudomonadota bacterium]
MEKVALVTGGARGIGRAIVENLSQDHRVAYTWHSTRPSASQSGDTILAMQSDLTRPGQPETVIEQVLQNFGRLDVIVNNAGLVKTTPKDSFVLQDHRDILDLNLLVPAELLAVALPHLQTGAAIVSISSMNAAFPPRDAVTYGASKAALNLWTRAMA